MRIWTNSWVAPRIQSDSKRPLREQDIIEGTGWFWQP